MRRFALLFPALGALISSFACSSDEDAASGAGGGASSSNGGAVTGGAGGEGGTDQTPFDWTVCQSTAAAWVRRGLMAVLGRRPESQAEADVYEDLLTSLRLLHASSPNADHVAKRALIELWSHDPGYALRWGDFVMDALRVTRVETKSQQSCYLGAVTPTDDGELARWVRDHSAKEQAPDAFSLNQLVASSLALDDLSPVYRAHLFATVTKPISGANVDFFELERARRQDFGATFFRSYLHRDLVCMGCHNSESSVTYDPDPAQSRAWPLDGLFEKALFGASDGQHPETESPLGTDEMRSRSMFRVSGVIDGDKQPFGWSSACGQFSEPDTDDPLAVDTYFGSVRGLRVSVWDLERALARGTQRIKQSGLTRSPGGEIADPDDAFAYLVATAITNQVFAEVMGPPLTIANYFPRNAFQKETLEALTNAFVEGGFSLRTLLSSIATLPLFNLQDPAEGCGPAYSLPGVYEPFSREEATPDRRGNSQADAVFPMSTKPMRRALHRAMDWPMWSEFPEEIAEERERQLAWGFFLKDAEPGFRGLDFQGRLSWEQSYGECASPDDQEDFIDALAARALASGATNRDVVLALKERLVARPIVESTAESAALEALMGAGLDAPVTPDVTSWARSICGALTMSPQFMMLGPVPSERAARPVLSDLQTTYDAVCRKLEQRAAARKLGFTIGCTEPLVTSSSP